MESQEVKKNGGTHEKNEVYEIPIIVSRGNASFLSEQLIVISNEMGFNYDTNTPYKIMMADNGDIIFRPWVKPNLLYHYCSPGAFEGIFSSKTLRMTDARFCNDETEQREFIYLLENLKTMMNQFEITDDILDRHITQVLAGKEITDEQKKIFLQYVEKLKLLTIEERTALYQSNLDSFFDVLYNDLTISITNNNPRYITCFCEQADVKSQWREYADAGKGFSIGFNTQHFSINSNIHLRSVLYHKNQQFELLNQALLQYEFDNNSIQQWIHEVIPVIKNQAFHEEREWRLIHTPPINIHEHTLKFGMMDYDRIYYEFPLNPEYISEIILGPLCEMTVQECIALLKSWSIELNERQVRKSEVPYTNSQNKK